MTHYFNWQALAIQSGMAVNKLDNSSSTKASYQLYFLSWKGLIGVGLKMKPNLTPDADRLELGVFELWKT